MRLLVEVMDCVTIYILFILSASLQQVSVLLLRLVNTAPAFLTDIFKCSIERRHQISNKSVLRISVDINDCIPVFNF